MNVSTKRMMFGEIQNMHTRRCCMLHAMLTTSLQGAAACYTQCLQQACKALQPVTRNTHNKLTRRCSMLHAMLTTSLQGTSACYTQCSQQACKALQHVTPCNMLQLLVCLLRASLVTNGVVACNVHNISTIELRRFMFQM